MLEQRYRVEVTAGFLARLESIEEFLVQADAVFAFDVMTQRNLLNLRR